MGLMYRNTKMTAIVVECNDELRDWCSNNGRLPTLYDESREREGQKQHL
jgi:hypothetical protein